MSLNWAMLAQDEPVLLPGEHQHLFRQHGIKAILDCETPDTRFEAKGKLYVSNQRIVFVAQPSTPSLQTLNIPLRNLRNWKLEQPWFSANYITSTLIPVPGGGLPRAGNLTLTFTEGGAIEFTSVYRTLLERLAVDGTTEEPLPAYEPPPYYNP
ncbi:hypothetical protein O0I10_002615 [Lichtheimia ornata]|uniref:GRAM domain-containing protein n=1 Tax=Lichtheimia ornata TaxID=688661 RepID=A0AAD7Y1S5_9FUNG|nr:uncharacterized protein O0I10_002615 [Lichtheimia ornata]KAJ8661806.1 hypothetical protein O0I10_002615 [Lichtheimia ornata]